MVAEQDNEFENEEDLFSFVETRVKQLNREIDDLERVHSSEQPEEFEEHSNRIEGEITELQGIVKENYIRFAGGEKNIADWEEIGLYSPTVTLLERLADVRNMNTVGV